MSGPKNCFDDVPNFSGTTPPPPSNIEFEPKLMKQDFNGHHSDNNFLPNNNLCENLVTSVCMSENNCVINDNRNKYCENNFEYTSKTDDINSLTENSSTTDSQLTVETQSSDTTAFDDKLQQQYQLFDNVSDHNGVVKKANNRKKRVTNSGPGRGRPKKALVAMYHSQISGDKNTIKIRIKKSNLSAQPNKKKSGRRKKHKNSDTDASDYETNKTKRSRPTSDNDVTSTQQEEPLEQSPWGSVELMPESILLKIFQNVCAHDGCLPALVKLCKVCKLWFNVSMKPELWRKADLNYVKEKSRTDLRIHWLILNRLTCCEDLNLGEWKVRDIQAVLEALCEHCSNLRGLNLSGWKGLNADNLKYLTTECKNLERLDLSSINVMIILM